MRKTCVVSMVLLSLSLAVACGGDSSPTAPTPTPTPTPTPPPPPPTQTATVFGRVQDAASSAGIEGATVIVEDHWARFAEVGRSVTAADGTYQITGISVAAGPEGGASLTIRAFAHGYVSGVEGWGTRARSPGGHNLDFNLEPAPTCTVVGSVRDQAGRGVAGASVQASTAYPWLQRRTMTGSDGRYAIPELTGSYFLDVIAEGYDDPPTREVSCPDAGQDSLVESDFTLEAGSPNADPDFIGWFWNQLVFNTIDCPPNSCGAPLERRSSSVLSTSSPDFHIRTHNDGGARVVSEERVQQILAEIPRIVATITGQPFGGRISDGSARSTGQITIEFIDLGTELCGRATSGAAQGLVEIHSQALSRDEFDSFGQGCPLFPVLRHEMAHAMGFFHVTYGGDLMSWLPEYVSDFSAREVHHMQLAYRLGPLQSRPYGPVMRRPGAFPPGQRPLVTIQCRAPVQ